MMGSMIKTFFAERIGKKPEDIVFVSIMPCVRKQGEADRDLDEFHSACPEDGTKSHHLPAIALPVVALQHMGRNTHKDMVA